MKLRILLVGLIPVLVIASALVLAPGSSYATPPPQVSIMEPDGTLHPSPGYRVDQLPPEYTADMPVIGPNDTYAQDEVILRFRPEVPIEQQNALMAAHGMRMGRPTYGSRTFVAKVPRGRALTVANALRGNPLLEVASVNAVIRAFHDTDPNDPLIGDQEHLTTINAYEGWRYVSPTQPGGHGLGKVSKIAIIDDAIDAGGPHPPRPIHPDFASKFKYEDWQTFIGLDPFKDTTGHGTHVGGLATADTNNGIGVAGVGFTAFPMSLQVLQNGGLCNAGAGTLYPAISAVNWASDHGATVINMSFGCTRGNPGCNPANPQDGVYDFEKAVAYAYNRGISVVAAAGNFGDERVDYPAAFGQWHDDDVYWPYNEKLVMAIMGTWHNERYRDPNIPSHGSSYGTWVDFGAPYRQEDGQWLLSTEPTVSEEGCFEPNYDRAGGTSASAPQVAGLAGLLTSQGYRADKIWTDIQLGARDLPCDDGVPCPGYDRYTGWGLIDVGKSMSISARPANGTAPGMAVVPNEGRRGVQWYELMGSGFTGGSTVSVCKGPVGQPPTCVNEAADQHGAVGIGVQLDAGDPNVGTWYAYMCQQGGNCTPTQTYIINP